MEPENAFRGELFAPGANAQGYRPHADNSALQLENVEGRLFALALPARRKCVRPLALPLARRDHRDLAVSIAF